MSHSPPSSPLPFSDEFLRAFNSFEVRTLRSPPFRLPSPIPSSFQSLIVSEVIVNHISVKKIADFLSLSRNQIYRMIENFGKGKTLNNHCGRPLLIDAIRQEEIKYEITLAISNKRALNSEELAKLIVEKAKLSSLSNGGNGLLKSIGMGATSIYNYSKKLNSIKEKGQKTTNARRDASLDVRNFISMAIMNAVETENLSHHCIGNLDATQFILKYTDQQKLISIDKLNIHSPTTRTEESTLDLLVKQIFLVNAAGFSSPPLFVISCESLGENEMVIVEVNGLSFSFDGKTNGLIVFCNSRNGNKLFFEWLFSTFVIEIVKNFKSRQSNSQNFYLVLDGEATQIQSLDNDNVRKLLSDNNIDIGKGPASCSGCCGNALDCGNLFKSIKTSLKGKHGIGQKESANSELELSINNEISKYNDKLKLSAEKKSKICMGIVHLLFYEMKCLDFSIIKKSFEKIGMIGENRLECTLTCCSNYQNIPKNQIELIKSSFINLSNIFRDHGEIKEIEYDALGIMKVEGSENSSKKDELVVYRQRAVLLTALESIERRKNYFIEKERLGREVEEKRKSKERERERLKEAKEEKQKEKKRKREEKDKSLLEKRQKMEEKAKRKIRRASLRGGGEGKGKAKRKSGRKEE